MPPYNVAVTLAYTTDNEGWNIEKEQNERPRTLWETLSPLKYGWQWNTFCLYVCQVWLWSTKWGRAKSDRVLQKNALVIENTLFQQHKRQLYTWTLPDGQYRNQIDYIICSQRWRKRVSKKQEKEWTVAQIMKPLLQNSELNGRK